MMTPFKRLFMCASLCGHEPELVGIHGKALAQDATGRLRFIVHAASWLHSMDACVGVLEVTGVGVWDVAGVGA